MTIGYFVSEFPGQTHAFFWREIKELRERGVSLDIVATRPAPRSNRPHGWSEEAIRQTAYLYPPTVGGFLGSLGTLLGAGPARWAACARECLGAPDAGLAQRVKLLTLLPAAAGLKRLATQRGWTHIHTHTCANAAAIAMLCRLLGGPPYSIVLHGPLSDYGPAQRVKWRNAAFGVVITKKLLAEAKSALGNDAPKGGFEIAAMGVDVGLFRRSRPYEAWRGEGPLRIVSCGRLNPCKGHLDLIEAAGMLRGRGIDAQVRILGQGEQMAELKARRAALGLDEAVDLPGAVAESEVRAAIESAHMFALASLHEPLGVALMEAMAMQTPVVSTAAGGVPELIDDGVDGVLAPPRDPTALAEAIERVARNADEAIRIGRAGRAKVERSFHSGVSAEMLKRRVLGGAAPVKHAAPAAA